MRPGSLETLERGLGRHAIGNHAWEDDNASLHADASPCPGWRELITLDAGKHGTSERTSSRTGSSSTWLDGTC